MLTDSIRLQTQYPYHELLEKEFRGGFCPSTISLRIAGSHAARIRFDAGAIFLTTSSGIFSGFARARSLGCI